MFSLKNLTSEIFTDVIYNLLIHENKQETELLPMLNTQLIFLMSLIFMERHNYLYTQNRYILKITLNANMNLNYKKTNIKNRQLFYSIRCY